MSWRGGRGSGEQAKPGGRRGKGAARSDGEKIDRWAVARHDFEDKSLGLHFWQKYLSGERFWVVREADAMHYWAKKDSAEERREAKIRRDELDFEFVTAPVVDLTGEDRERVDSSPAAKRPRLGPGEQPTADAPAASPSAREVVTGAGPQTGKGIVDGGGAHAGSLGVKRVADSPPTAALRAGKGSKEAAKRTVERPPPRRASAEEGARPGNAYQSQGDFSKAIEYHAQDLAIAKEVGERAGEGQAYANLGNAYFSQGDFSKAIQYHGQHLAIAKVDAAHDASRANIGDSVTFSSEHLAQVLCAALRTKVAMKALVRDVKAKDDAFRMVQQSSQADGAYTNMQIAETIAKCRPAQVSNASELLSWLVKEKLLKKDELRAAMATRSIRSVSRDKTDELLKKIVTSWPHARPADAARGAQMGDSGLEGAATDAQVHDEDRQKHAKLAAEQSGLPAAGEAHSGETSVRDELDAELKAKFAEYGLGHRCDEICAQLEVTCVSDLVLVDQQDVEDLKLKSVTKEKLLEIICSVKRRKTEGGGGGCGHKGGGGAKYNPKFGDGPRVALCIGNDNYNIGNILPNCVADAQDMGACCENQLGFDKTIVLTDANKATIWRVVREMRDDHVKDGSLVLVFFSGHGVEHEGVSYLLPIGMESQNEQDLEEEAVSANWIMKMFSNFTSTVNVLLLDCCRDDQLNNTFTKSKGPGDNGAKGFGKSLRSTNRNAEFLVGSACDPGSSALPNDDARNSRYTEALLRHLPAAGRELEKSMKEAGKDVFKDTHKKQRPWVSNCLMQDVVLVRA